MPDVIGSGRGREEAGVRRRRRAAGARWLLGGVIVFLLGAFFRLQILRTSRYVLQSEQNRLRAISVPAPRGTIYDRGGRVVAENVPGYTVSLLPGREDTVRAALDRIAPHLGLDEDAKADLVRKYRRFPKRPLVVDEDASFREVSAIEERRPQFRRAVVEMRPRRRYPAGALTAHVTGYVGEISEAELADTAFAGYDPGRVVGKTGLEREYETRLGGEPGVRYMEVTALGSIVREFGPREGVEPTPGEDVRLALDLSLQRFTDSLFPGHREGALVAMDPRTGGVLTLYSHPAFDPNAFVGGVDREVWDGLRDDPDEPILNRVTGAAYSPGSTWKLVVATESMRRGIVTIGDRMEIPCRGALRYGGRLFRCWRPEGHGSLTLAGAIQQSCNVYFYQLGLRLGLDGMLEAATRLGYNRPTGIDLPHELSGHFPESRDWFDRRYGPRGWSTGVVLNLAIGQGENDQTLLRQALFYTALATGERPLVPHLARRAAGETPRVDWSLDLPEARRRELVEAMRRVVNEPDGTAYAWRLRRWTMAGKTGTAQNPQGEPHSWFIGFAPLEAPEIVVAAFVEHGHPDNTTSLAVPLATRVARRYLETRHPEEAGGPPTPAREVRTPDAPGVRTVRPPPEGADSAGGGESGAPPDTSRDAGGPRGAGTETRGGAPGAGEAGPGPPPGEAGA